MKPLFALGCSLTLSLTLASTALAVQPAPIERDARVAWSQVVNDPFDGTVVYDKNFDPSDYGFSFVSSWSKDGIRATYTYFESEIVGYKTVWRTRTVRDRHGKERREDYSDNEPIYQHTRIDRVPRAIRFAINGQRYTYERGPVGPELAAALASAPLQNMRIRLVWSDDGTTDMDIGKATVAAWKTVFKASSPNSVISGDRF